MRSLGPRPGPPVNIGRVLQNAVVFNFARHRSGEDFMNASNIPDQVARFFALLEAKQIDYLLVGGVAMLAHVRGRNTEDIDLVISLSEQERLAPEVKVIERDSFFAKANFESLRVDFLAAEHSLFAEVARDCAEERVFAFLPAQRAIRCATPRGLLTRKLYALPSLYRQGQIDRAKIYESDIGRLLAAFPQIETEEILGILRRHGMSESDMTELRHVLAEQRPRPDRFQGDPPLGSTAWS